MTAESVTPRLVAALDRAWSQIRAQHLDVSEVVITLGSGPDGNGPVRLGHFAGEGLARGPADVLATLLHEAAHGTAAVENYPLSTTPGL